MVSVWTQKGQPSPVPTRYLLVATVCTMYNPQLEVTDPICNLGIVPGTIPRHKTLSTLTPSPLPGDHTYRLISFRESQSLPTLEFEETAGSPPHPADLSQWVRSLFP